MSDFSTVINNFREQMVNDLLEFIGIVSVESQPVKGKPFGEGSFQALEFVLNKGKEFGFRVKNLDGYAGVIEIGEGDATIGVLCHVDVVEAGDGWITEPFQGTLTDGNIYGRGSIDDKGPVISCLYAMKILYEAGMLGNKKIRMILGTDEETLWKSIEYYLEHEKAPDVSFTPDGNFPLIYGEKGLLQFDLIETLASGDSYEKGQLEIIEIHGGSSKNSVASKCTAELRISDALSGRIIDAAREYEKQRNIQILIDQKNSDSGYMNLTVFGKSAHAMAPEDGINAICHLFNLLEELPLQKDGKTHFVKKFNEYIGLDYYGTALGCNMEDEKSGKLTFNVGKIQLTDKEGIIEADIRYPISSTYEAVKNAVIYGSSKAGFNYREVDTIPPICFSKEDELIKKLMQVYRETTGDYKNDPIVIGGATYARAIPNTVAFGPVFPWQEELAHQANEYISVEDFMTITNIYTNALFALCN